MSFIDEAKLRDRLPQYVASGPDEMPSCRLYEGDLNVLMVLMREIGNKVEGLAGCLAATTRQVTDLQAQLWPSLPASTSGRTVNTVGENPDVVDRSTVSVQQPPRLADVGGASQPLGQRRAHLPYGTWQQIRTIGVDRRRRGRLR